MKQKQNFKQIAIAVIVSICLFMICYNKKDKHEIQREIVDVPIVTETQKKTAISSIKEQSNLIKEAGIFQNKEELKLILIVNSAMNEKYAKYLGDNFVRLVKTCSEDYVPQKDIGTGIYDYIIGIYTMDKKEKASGYKYSGNNRIVW